MGTGYTVHARHEEQKWWSLHAEQVEEGGGNRPEASNAAEPKDPTKITCPALFLAASE